MNLKVTIEKLVPGGQGLARLDDGRVCFVWGGLPGEEVEIELLKNKRKLAQAMVVKVLKPSKYRVEPRDDAWMSTSPWQIMSFGYENEQKHELIIESFRQQGIKLPEFHVQTEGQEYEYRNKMEYSFWWTPDTDEVDLSFHKRGTRIRVPANESSLAHPSINKASRALKTEINRLGILAKQLKSCVLRCSAEGQVVVALFVKDKLDVFKEIELDASGMQVWYSNPKSPASVCTELLHEVGDIRLKDELAGREFGYDVHSFFQVNIGAYELALGSIRNYIPTGVPVVDMFSGVGSIGLSVASGAKLIEADDASVAWAQKNAGDEEVIHAKAEDSDSYIEANQTLIVDPPRAGLHQKTVQAILTSKPKRVIYLSCEASTHARDVRSLIDGGYELTEFEAFNFFPHTPHTETLAVLDVIE